MGCFFQQSLDARFIQLKPQQDLVIESFKIDFEGYPNAHNPSLIETSEGFLLTFRWLPDPLNLWYSLIGIVALDEHLLPKAKPQILDTRPQGKRIPSQSEDARIFRWNGELYLIYNDNPTFLNPSSTQRRDMHIAKLEWIDNAYKLSLPLKLFHPLKYPTAKWQKNWVPFEWEGNLLFSYSIIPHEVLFADAFTGECHPCIQTACLGPNWKWGVIRGGTPAQAFEGEYLAFFHSSLKARSLASEGVEMHHYFAGAYTFESNPPFSITAMSQQPIIGEQFYTLSACDKRVIFPGGFVVKSPFIYLAYGKDDSEIWIAKIDETEFKKTLIPVKKAEASVSLTDE